MTKIANLRPMHWTERAQQLMREAEPAISVRELADRVGMQYDALRKAFSRSTDNPRGKVIEKIAKELGVHPIWLRDGVTPGATTTIEIKSMDRGYVFVTELDVRAEGGHGLQVPEREKERGRWALPKDILEGRTTAPASGLRIITVYGTSMAPDYQPGDRVMVDTEDRLPSPAGTFALWDGFGLVIKYVEMIPYSDPPMVRLISVNKAFHTYEIPAADVTINGRVIGKWTWT